MVVLADDPFLAANVPVSQQCQQVGREIASLGQFQGLLGRGREGGLPDDRGLPFVQELHRQVGHDLAVIAQGEPAGRTNSPRSVASTCSAAQSALSAGHGLGGTASTIRSWASEIQISV